MLKYIKQIWHSKALRNKILFTLFALGIYRLAAHITLPGADVAAIRAIFDQNELLGVYNLLTGGTASQFSIIMMGLSPYINASIIMQLMAVISPKLEAMSKEGEQGRRKMNQYTRWLTVPLAFIQSYGMIKLLELSHQGGGELIAGLGSPDVLIPVMMTVTAGTIFLMWLGEIMTEKGIGNGISLIITGGILAGLPSTVGRTLAIAEGSDAKFLYGFLALTLVVIILTVVIVLTTEAQRLIPITYAGRGIKSRGENSVLPIRINQAGMIPIIFAVSLMSLPTFLARFFIDSQNQMIASIAQFFDQAFNTTGVTYLVVYFLLIVAFTYFYVSITFNPVDVAENIQKRGGFIPGLRPGRETANYLARVSNRLTFFGSMFLAFVATFPLLLQMLFRDQLSIGEVPVLIGGAGMIIIVGVALELFRQVRAQLIMHDYDKLY